MLLQCHWRWVFCNLVGSLGYLKDIYMFIFKLIAGAFLQLKDDFHQVPPLVCFFWLVDHCRYILYWLLVSVKDPFVHLHSSRWGSWEALWSLWYWLKLFGLCLLSIVAFGLQPKQNTSSSTGFRSCSELAQYFSVLPICLSYSFVQNSGLRWHDHSSKQMSLAAFPTHLPYIGKLLLPLFWPLSVWAVAVGGKLLLPPQAEGYCWCVKLRVVYLP